MRQARRFPLGRFPSTGLNVVLAVGAVAAATAVIEAALIPGLAIGAVVVVAPRLLAKRSRKGRRAAHPAVPRARALSLPRAAEPKSLVVAPVRSLRLKEAGLKTISFRIIVTILDFGFNYMILGDIVTSAGLSAFSLAAGPFFYFLHETGWTYLRPLLPIDWRVAKAQVHYTVFGLSISHAIAKTITYRLFATASEFTTNFVVVQDLVTAAYLSSFGFFIGPFVYYAHERLWEAMDARAKAQGGSPVLALPSPALAF